MDQVMLFEVDQKNKVLKAISEISNSEIVVKPSMHREKNMVKFKVLIQSISNNSDVVSNYISELKSKLE